MYGPKKEKTWAILLSKIFENWLLLSPSKLKFIWELAPTDYQVVSCQYLKFFFLIISLPKIILDNTPMYYWIYVLCSHFDSFFLVKSVLQNLKVGRKKLENLCQFQFSNKYPFSFLTYLPMRFIGWKLNKEFSDVFRLTLLNLSQLKQHYIWKK